jgi:hypothetical protein
LIAILGAKDAPNGTPPQLQPTTRGADETPPPGLLIYQSPDGTSRIHVRLDQKSLWLSQRQLANLFQKDTRTINEHIQNVFVEGELPPEATLRKFRIVQTEDSRGSGGL